MNAFVSENPVLLSTAVAPAANKAAAWSTDRPKIAYLVSRYPAVSHTFILREVRELRALGFDIACASVNAPDRSQVEMSAEERAEAADTYYLKAHGVRGALLAHLHGLLNPVAYCRGLWHALASGGWNLRRMLFGFFYFTEALMLARWMKAGGYRHLHVHFGTAAANIGLALKKLMPLYLSLTIHGPDEFYDVPGERLVEKFSAADLVVCIGRFARSQVMKLVPSSQWQKFVICPLGVDTSNKPAPRVRRPGQPFTILCVGRLTSSKGQHILLDACAALRDWGRDFRLVLVGGGPDEEALRRASTRLELDGLVEITGPLTQAEVQTRLAEADVFALPSFAEGIPVALMEAMASGVPCVSTRITGIPELIRDGLDGMLTTPSDVLELSETLAQLMDDPELRRDLSVSAGERVAELYDLRTNVAHLAGVFKARCGGALHG